MHTFRNKVCKYVLTLVLIKQNSQSVVVASLSSSPFCIYLRNEVCSRLTKAINQIFNI